jgi:hypothetical protein
MPEFDPYWQWFRIPPGEEPRDHYRLLGITLLETNPVVIANAANQRIACVQAFQTPENSALCQRILDAIVAAKKCLLNPHEKAEYDQQFCDKLALPTSATSPILPPQELAAPTDDSNVADWDFSLAANTGLHPAYHKPKGRGGSWMRWAYLGGVLVAAIIVMVTGNCRRMLEFAERQLQQSPESHPPASPKTTLKVSTPQAVPKAQPNTKPKPQAPEQPPERAEPGPSLPREPDDAKQEPIPEIQLEQEPPRQPRPAEQAAKKRPVPEHDARERSLVTIRNVYGEDIQAGRAEKLIAAAKDTKDVTDRFALLQTAEGIAAKAARLHIAFTAIDAMTAEYEVSAATMKAEAIETAAKKTRITAEQRMDAAERAVEVADEAICEDNFEVARHLNTRASQLASAIKDKDLRRRIVAQKKEVHPRG